ncbi:hypothetical protein [Sphingomonas sp. Leaf257]|jgi:hypothetical protein|uniref:hypothetical protein n=1 Tax=Sphingomonas sp. Leaf257 TaxID=1736309 RepID=UPI0006F20569|nr:hypothetical protein [Sphingomonas sp. Leaf257]KQO50718.1 hypothetical protein ASF14_11620 [Sphingomonas sp. Leaf257]
MAVEPDPHHASSWHATRLSDRVTAARARAAGRRRGAVLDLRLDAESRLTDQVRFEVTARLHHLVETIAHDLLQQADRDMPEGGGQPQQQEVLRLLYRADALADPALVDELVAQVRQGLIARALPIESMAGDAPSLLVRLTEAPDRIVAAAARAVLLAEGRSREGDEAVGLPTRLHDRLVWTVAAALRKGDDPTWDRALAQAVERVLAARDDGDRPGLPAMRLAAAIDARPGELPDLLLESLSDRQLGLFVSLLTHALGIEHDMVREIVLEPEGDRLWLALRSLDQDRPVIARIGLSLCEADGRRDVDGFAEALDAIMAIPAEEARRAIASLSLPAPFREAIERLEGSDRR